MKKQLALSLLLSCSFAVPLIGCGSDNSPGGGAGGAGGGAGGGGGSLDSGTGGTGGTVTKQDSGTGGSGTDAGGTGGAKADAASTAAVTYEDVKPIFVQKCTPCHATGGQGAFLHTLATSSADANKVSSECAPKKVGECVLVLVKSGHMPLNAGCSGNPTTDAAKTACLTQGEQDKLAAWAAGGLK